MAKYTYGSGWSAEFTFTRETLAELEDMDIPASCIPELQQAVTHAMDYRAAFDAEPQESDKLSKARDLIKALDNASKKLREADGHFGAAMQSHAARVFGVDFAPAHDLPTFERLLQMWSNAAYWASEEINPQRGQRNDAEQDAKRLLSHQALNALKEAGVRVSSTETGGAANTLRILFDAAGFESGEAASMERYLPKKRKRA